MNILGAIILLFTLPLSAQTEAQDSVIIFYTTETAGVGRAPIVYSQGQKIGEANKGQFIRFIVRPGIYQFALTEDAPPAQQLSVSIGSGQEIFLRVTRTSFFIGTAAEAKTSLGVTADSVTPQVNAAKTSSASLLTPPALATGIVHGNVPAVPRPDSHAQSVQVKQSISSQGTPGILSCAFRGTLSLHATIQPGSPVVAGVPCGDPVLLIDQGLGASHIRTQTGKTASFWVSIWVSGRFRLNCLYAALRPEHLRLGRHQRRRVPQCRQCRKDQLQT
jgi:hypothetical protein